MLSQRCSFLFSLSLQDLLDACLDAIEGTDGIIPPLTVAGGVLFGGELVEIQSGFVVVELLIMMLVLLSCLDVFHELGIDEIDPAVDDAEKCGILVEGVESFGDVAFNVECSKLLLHILFDLVRRDRHCSWPGSVLTMVLGRTTAQLPCKPNLVSGRPTLESSVPQYPEP